MNQKNSLGLDNCFLDLADPFELFEKWYDAAKEKELNDPNALALATCKNNIPSVRMVLLKNFNKDGFVFYTNLNSQKSNEIKENSNVSMCFHWKSLLRQIRITGSVNQVNDEIADKYYNSRSYESRIGAWASKQSSVLNSREELLSSIQKFKSRLLRRDSRLLVEGRSRFPLQRRRPRRRETSRRNDRQRGLPRADADPSRR